MALRVLAISGSLRRDSYNRRALQIAKRLVAAAGAEVTELDLKELALPVYDQDIQEAGMPAAVEKLKQAVAAADVLLIASPENNYSISSALKNAFDWGSRQGNSWFGKTAIVLGVSDGPYGTVRGQFHIRQIFVSLNILSLPAPMILIRNAPDCFTPTGDFADPKATAKLTELIEKTLAITTAWQAINKKS